MFDVTRRELKLNELALANYLHHVSQHGITEQTEYERRKLSRLPVELHNVRTGETKLVRIGEMTQDDFLAYDEWQQMMVAEWEARNAATREVQ